MVARRLTGSTKPAPEVSELPVAVPVPVGTVVGTTAFAATLDGEQKAIKFTKRTQRFGGAALGGPGPVVAWDGRIAEAPAVRSIAPLERVRAGASGSGAASSNARAPTTNSAQNVERVVNSGSVTP